MGTHHDKIRNFILFYFIYKIINKFLRFLTHL
jgi:hypothetical protein